MYIIKNAFKCIGRDKFSQMMGNSQSLTLEEYNTYAGAESVQDFYYTLTASFDGNEGLDPVTTEEEEETEKEIMAIFRELANRGKCVILVSHSPAVANLCDERYELLKVSKK